MTMDQMYSVIDRSLAARDRYIVLDTLLVGFGKTKAEELHEMLNAIAQRYPQLFLVSTMQDQVPVGLKTTMLVFESRTQPQFDTRQA